MTASPAPRPDELAHAEKKLDTKTVEVLALAVFRTMFRDGICVPLKMNGTMDMDLVVKDNNILLNMNRVQAEVPELSIWRITFAYHGKPVLEYGRGIKNEMKIHYPQMGVLLLAAWREKRRKNKAKIAGDEARKRDMIALSVHPPHGGTSEEAAL
jgi:hypothetical protein